MNPSRGKEHPEFMTVSEVAMILGRSVAFVRRLCAQRRLGTRKHGRYWIITPDELKALVIAPPGRPPKKNPKKSQQIVTAAMQRYRELVEV